MPHAPRDFYTMKYFSIRFQLVLVSILLLITLGMVVFLLNRFNSRWDFTREKIYSLSPSTLKLLDIMKEGKLEVLAFYPHDDPARSNFEVFLKEMKLHHPAFSYQFYDPDRVPRMANQLNIKDFYTILIRYDNQTERIVGPTEENITNALLRLSNPKKFGICFVTGHAEASLAGQDRNGLSSFKQALENNNYAINEILLARDKIPTQCSVVIVAGPHRDMDADELNLLNGAFEEGKGIFFMIDPMDLGTGKTFTDYMKGLGVVLGEDVIVDKMSRMAGGDFLMPLVGQYLAEHPITADFDKPTLFPVARSVQPSTESPKSLEVDPLALTGSGSWAETDLANLEKGEAAFESETDLSGPISLAVAIQTQSDPKGGRWVIVGDSDFIVNAYLNLSGNADLALNIVRWLTKDDRFINIQPRQPQFKPLILSKQQRMILFAATLGALPCFFLIVGSIYLILRKRPA
jgi:ABC-type uncharacterized transport system involved in gliding motility auxiliary subunit